MNRTYLPMRNVNFETVLVHVLFFGTASCERLLSLLNGLQEGQGAALDLHPLAAHVAP